MASFRKNLRSKIAFVLLIFSLLLISNPVFSQSTDDNTRIADQVPEFAGLYYVGTVLHINLTKQSPELQGKIVLVIKNEFPAALAGDPPVVFETVRYGFNELRDWYAPLVEISSSYQFVTTVGIDEKKNKIEIGVVSSDDIATLKEAFSTSGVPEDAISIEVRGRINFDQDTKTAFPIWGVIALSAAAVVGLFILFVFPRIRNGVRK